MKYGALSCLVILLLIGCQEDVSITDSEQRIQPDYEITVPQAFERYRQLPQTARTRITLKDFMNETIFSGQSLKVSEIHICKSYDPATAVTTLDQQFESTLQSRWVPNDQRRDWNGDGNLQDIDWVGFAPFALANGAINAVPIYTDMYDVWENDGYCNTVDIEENSWDGISNPSVILAIGGLQDNGPIADVSVVGFLPAFIFEAVLGAENILGVAFSFVFIDENGDPTSTTRGKDDKAFTEIWFNDGFTWSNDPQFGIDIESVVLHEFGHSLNLGHFGILQRFDFADGTFDLVYQPVNTMNALYIGEEKQTLGQNDKGNFCEAWGSWPWN